MSGIEQRAAKFDSYFDSLKKVRAKVDKEGKVVRNQPVLPDPYDAAKQANASATLEQMKRMDSVGNASEFDKLAAYISMGDTSLTKGNITKQKKLVREGIEAIDIVTLPFRDGSEVVMNVNKDIVTLYPSYGLGDLDVHEERYSNSGSIGRRRELRASYKNGLAVNGSPSLDKIIKYDQETSPVTIIGDLNIYKHRGPDGESVLDPFKELRKWDPTHPSYDPGFIRLGSASRPVEVTDYIETDSQKFALRTAVALSESAQWLIIDRPSDAFRNKLVNDFAHIYWTLLAHGEPSDTIQKSILHNSRMSGAAHLESRSKRHKSLTDYNPRELAAIYKGADVTHGDIEMVTREKIDEEASKAVTMRDSYHVMQARRDIDLLFEKMRVSESLS